MFRLTLSQSDSTGAQAKYPMSLSRPLVNVLRRFSAVQEKVNIRLVVLSRHTAFLYNSYFSGETAVQFPRL